MGWSNRRIDSPGLRFAGPPSLRLWRKEGKEKKRKPLYARSGERGDDRSDVGVSRFDICQEREINNSLTQ